VRSRQIDAVLWVATVACIGTTLYLSLAAVPPGTHLFHGVDKVQHAVAYFVTSFLFLLAAVWRPGRGPGPLAHLEGWVTVGMIAMGGLIELVQARFGRDAELGDWLAEVGAVLLAWLVIRMLRRRAAVEASP
jgi:choline-glycine betaine transporter